VARGGPLLPPPPPRPSLSLPPHPTRYAPLFLILLALIEAGPAPWSRAALPLALTFAAAWASHAASMAFDAPFAWRVRGSTGTFLALLGAAAVLVVRAAVGAAAAVKGG